MKKTKLLYCVALLLLMFAATGCLGPKPIVEGYTSHPPQTGTDQPFRVEATIRNGGPGGGQVEVEVTLLNKQTGEVIRKESSDIDLQQNETQHVLFEIDLPPSAHDLSPDNIEVQVDAHYPIE